MQQLFFVHGGTTFDNKKEYLEFLKKREIRLDKKASWTGKHLEEALGKGIQYIRPRMPLQDNAHYDEWKIHFERHFPYMEDGIILIGNSLGGIFLARYLSENKFPKSIRAVHLVCPPYDDSLPDEPLTNGFMLGDDLSLLEEQPKNLTLHFSKDDPVVPESQADKYKRRLKKASFKVYESKNGHFLIEEFPEIAALIKEELKHNL